MDFSIWFYHLMISHLILLLLNLNRFRWLHYWIRCRHRKLLSIILNKASMGWTWYVNFLLWFTFMNCLIISFLFTISHFFLGFFSIFFFTFFHVYVQKRTQQHCITLKVSTFTGFILWIWQILRILHFRQLTYNRRFFVHLNIFD